MEWSGMETVNAKPTKVVVPDKDAGQTVWQQFLDEKVRAFVKEFVMFQFDRERVLRVSKQKKKTSESHSDKDQGVPTGEKSNVEPGEQTIPSY